MENGINNGKPRSSLFRKVNRNERLILITFHYIYVSIKDKSNYLQTYVF